MRNGNSGFGNSQHNGPDGFLRHNWELAEIYFDRHSIWEHLEP